MCYKFFKQISSYIFVLSIDHIQCVINSFSRYLPIYLFFEGISSYIFVLSTDIFPYNLYSFDRCLPVYCKYKFFKEPDYVTTAKEHDKKIYWNDTNVLLLGKQPSSYDTLLSYVF